MREQPGEHDRPSAIAADALPATRPGVPRLRPPSPDPGAHGAPPEPQRMGIPPQGAGRVLRTTPVYGTAQPLHGVAGAVRRAAYRVPEHRARRWAMLLAADRLEVLGRRAVAAAWLVPAAIGLAAGYAAVSRALGRR